MYLSHITYYYTANNENKWKNTHWHMVDRYTDDFELLLFLWNMHRIR